jgi:hypothetical protein
MMNSGKQLERLVREIEERLLPEGFTVSSSERVFDDSGVQIAEFDIEITGSLGSASIKWLIECRDRPSEGPAPGAWIEQLVGRRDRFKFDKVTAVSTTGFAKGARDYAGQKAIELRSVDRLTLEDIASWFRPTCLGLLERRGDLTHVNLELDADAAPDVVEALKLKLADASAERPLPNASILVHTATGQALTIRDAWQDVINQNPQMFDGLSPNGETKQLTVEANYTNPESRYQILTDAGPVHVVQIMFRATLSVTTREVPVSRIAQYAKTLEQEAVAQSVSFAFKAGDTNVDLAFRNLLAEGGTFITMHTSPSDES